MDERHRQTEALLFMQSKEETPVTFVCECMLGQHCRSLGNWERSVLCHSDLQCSSFHCVLWLTILDHIPAANNALINKIIFQP